MRNLQEVLAVKEKLSTLKEKDKDFRVFGSSRHRYELSAPLPETQIESFEKENHLKLPADYRAFLTEIGNGGAGPFYGIFKFEKAFAGCKPNEIFKWKSDASVKFHEDSDFDEWHDHRRGVIEICEQGCGTYNFLVVNGSSYGEVWTDCFDELFPENISFSKFYNHWLDRNLKRINNIPLLKSVKKGMTKIEMIEIFGNDWREIQNETGAKTIRIAFDFVPAAFVLDEDVLIRIDDYSKMLV